MDGYAEKSSDAPSSSACPLATSSTQGVSAESSEKGKKRLAETEIPQVPRKFTRWEALNSHPLHKLMRRELEPCSNKYLRSLCTAKFRNMRLQAALDTFDPAVAQSWKLSFLRQRSHILEIVSAQDLVFALCHSGLCAAFSRGTHRRICYLNVKNDEVVRSLFYNKTNSSLITVSVHSEDDYSSLRCRSTPLDCIRRGKPEEGLSLFESECLRWPGFVEFDDVNRKVLTYSAQTRVYKVFDLKNYSLTYSIRDNQINEMKISPGNALLIMQRTGDRQPLRILSIADGSPKKEIVHTLRPGKKVDFVEQFSGKLLVKQESENLQIIDVDTGRSTEVLRTEFMVPTAFIFLYDKQLFLTFQHQTVSVWNFAGELISSFQDHQLWYPDSRTNNIYITQQQEVMISYCRPPKPDEHHRQGSPEARVSNPNAPMTGTITISNITSGRFLAQVSEECCPGGDEEKLRVKAALTDVTALFYDEDRNEIYTGNRGGMVHVWGLGPPAAPPRRSR